MKSADARINNMSKPIQLKISKITDENPFVKTFYFSHALKSQPGQFVMLWIPGLDQKPFSVAYDNGKSFGLTIFKRGPTTEKLFAMKVGDRVGISGPYGTYFTVDPRLHYIMVAGGYGAAPLGNLAEALQGKAKIDFIVGARSKDLLLFQNRLKKIKKCKLNITTDDGSAGHKGYVTDLLPELLKKDRRALVVTCGPEIMQKKILDICNEHRVNCEVSIERYMKCGVGVCGQCSADPLGICLCTEGPVVSGKIASQITEFGKYHRDKTGAKVVF